MEPNEVRIGHERACLALSRASEGLRARLILPDLQAESVVHLTDAALEENLASFSLASRRSGGVGMGLAGGGHTKAGWRSHANTTVLATSVARLS